MAHIWKYSHCFLSVIMRSWAWERCRISPPCPLVVCFTYVAPGTRRWRWLFWCHANFIVWITDRYLMLKFNGMQSLALKILQFQQCAFILCSFIMEIFMVNVVSYLPTLKIINLCQVIGLTNQMFYVKILNYCWENRNSFKGLLLHCINKTPWGCCKEMSS